MFHKIDGLCFGKSEEGRTFFYIMNILHQENACELHELCGKAVKVGEVVILRMGEIDEEFCIKALLIREGLISLCCIGHTKKGISNHAIMPSFENTLCQVVYSDVSEIVSKRHCWVIRLVVIGNCAKELKN